MRVIINDKRYSALKTLAERKQAFSEVGCRRIAILQKLLEEHCPFTLYVAVLEPKDKTGG